MAQSGDGELRFPSTARVASGVRMVQGTWTELCAKKGTGLLIVHMLCMLCFVFIFVNAAHIVR